LGFCFLSANKFGPNGNKKKDLLGNFIIFCCLVWLPGWFLMGRLKVIQWGSCKMTRLETPRQVPAFAVVISTDLSPAVLETLGSRTAGSCRPAAAAVLRWLQNSHWKGMRHPSSVFRLISF
jgi:hypothetical protein